MPETHEWMFYEVMWRAYATGNGMPLPRWVQQYFRYWVDSFDAGLFESKETAFSSNAAYRYWNMVGVKDAHQESLIGQSGEVEPVYDRYSLSFFLFDPANRTLHLPQHPGRHGARLKQELENNYLPSLTTTLELSALPIRVVQKTFATTIGMNQRSLVLSRFRVEWTGGLSPITPWFCVSVSPFGPTGFKRRDRAGRNDDDRRINLLKYLPAEQRLLINSSWGPIFDSAPVYFGTYGNGNSYDPNFYLQFNPFEDLRQNGQLNGWDTATDYIAGMCTAVFVWPINLSAASPLFTLDVRLPVDDYRGAQDLIDLRSPAADTLESNNRTYWQNKLDGSGLQVDLPPLVRHLFDLFRACRANLLILADNGEIHPGPTIYDSFWIRDSSVEGVACALVGDSELSVRQFSFHYPQALHHDGWDDSVSLSGFIGQDHEINDREWDSNGEALWAIGRMDRILGPGRAFGAGLFGSLVLQGARWLRDNRSVYGLLNSGWSAEHIGDKGQPHYWDDFWGLAGLWEAAQLAERIGAPQTQEIWDIFNDLKRATADSILWVTTEQHRRGQRETFIPTGPGDVGRLDSTMIGAVSYFHPCRLYMGSKLGDYVEWAARCTLDTIWSHFVDGGFRHDAAWNCYGPYLTLQLAHAFLLIGDIKKMDTLLTWCVNAGLAKVSRDGAIGDPWQVVLGAWNEQRCYPIAKEFAEVPDRWWYMGDIPHGWACAEFNLLLRDILFFEADEDGSPHIYLAPGVMPHWLSDGQSVEVRDAPTLFERNFGYRLTHRQTTKTLKIQITQPLPKNVSFIFPCRFGSPVTATADGSTIPLSGSDVKIPSGTNQISIVYR
jgi:hypothetical protein